MHLKMRKLYSYLIILIHPDPNPPEAIRVEEQTTSAINISWGRPLDMDLGQYNFTVFSSHYQHTTLADYWALMEKLTSGTQYNISVATVGPLGYQSVPVQISATTSEWS